MTDKLETSVYNPSAESSANSHVKSLDDYRTIYDRSVSDPEGFWAEQAEQRITWSEKWHTVRQYDFHKAEIAWYLGGKLNASYNCVDRHVEAGRGGHIALIWEGNDPTDSKTYTYAELQAEVQKAANALKNLGIVKGDRVCIYMQMIPELAIAMLACARIGAVHSIVFGAFTADSLVTRINDSQCKAIITQDVGVRGAKQNVAMKANADKAVEKTPSIEKILVVQRTGSPVDMIDGRDVWWHEALAAADATCPARGDGRRRPALHSVHLRIDREAQGRAAHHRRIPDLRRDHLQLCLRLPPGRHLLVHG